MTVRWRDNAEYTPADYHWPLGRRIYNLKGCPRCGYHAQEGVFSIHIRCKRCKLAWAIWSDTDSDGSREPLDSNDSNYLSYDYGEYHDVMVDLTKGQVWVGAGSGDGTEVGSGLFVVRVERAEDL